MKLAGFTLQGAVPERSKGAGRNPAGYQPTKVRILPPPLLLLQGEVSFVWAGS